MGKRLHPPKTQGCEEEEEEEEDTLCRRGVCFAFNPSCQDTYSRNARQVMGNGYTRPWGRSRARAGRVHVIHRRKRAKKH